MTTTKEYARAKLFLARAELESTLELLEALKQISEQTEGQLVGLKNHTGKAITQFLFAVAIVTLFRTTLWEGMREAQIASMDLSFFFPKELSDRCFNETSMVSNLLLQADVIIKESSMANLSAPYGIKGIDIDRIANDFCSESGKITRLIGTINEMLET